MEGILVHPHAYDILHVCMCHVYDWLLGCYSSVTVTIVSIIDNKCVLSSVINCVVLVFTFSLERYIHKIIIVVCVVSLLCNARDLLVVFILLIEAVCK